MEDGQLECLSRSLKNGRRMGDGSARVAAAAVRARRSSRSTVGREALTGAAGAEHCGPSHAGCGAAGFCGGAAAGPDGTAAGRVGGVVGVVSVSWEDWTWT